MYVAVKLDQDHTTHEDLSPDVVISSCRMICKSDKFFMMHLEAGGDNIIISMPTDVVK